MAARRVVVQAWASSAHGRQRLLARTCTPPSCRTAALASPGGGGSPGGCAPAWRAPASSAHARCKRRVCMRAPPRPARTVSLSRRACSSAPMVLQGGARAGSAGGAGSSAAGQRGGPLLACAAGRLHRGCCPPWCPQHQPQHQQQGWQGKEAHGAVVQIVLHALCLGCRARVPSTRGAAGDATQRRLLLPLQLWGVPGVPGRTQELHPNCVRSARSVF